MVGALQGKCPPNMAAALSEVIREEGLKGLYRGWGASCLKVMPSSGITRMFYEAWKDILLVQNGNPLQANKVMWIILYSIRRNDKTQCRVRKNNYSESCFAMAASWLARWNGHIY